MDHAHQLVAMELKKGQEHARKACSVKIQYLTNVPQRTMFYMKRKQKFAQMGNVLRTVNLEDGEVGENAHPHVPMKRIPKGKEQDPDLY